jgi:hypothetical protein
MGIRGPEDNTPLVRYTDDHLWSNPEENQQYQVKLNRITEEYGYSSNFSYMNKWRTLPKKNTFFHVFSAGGLHPGFWNFKNNTLRRNPLDRWVNIGLLCKARGLKVDVYSTKGYSQSRSHCWLMVTYDGLVLIAIQKLGKTPVVDGDAMRFRCYTPSVLVDKSRLVVNETGNPYIFETCVYENPGEYGTFLARYNAVKARPGYTGLIHNGVEIYGTPADINPIAPGDVIEFWHDPTVLRADRYAYTTLLSFHSDLDQKKKLILHPPKIKGDFTIRYFDDNDYFLLGAKRRGLYLHRNDEKTIRQLTHVDVAVADDVVNAMTEYHPDLSDPMDCQILVLVRKTAWVFQWPHEHQRIRYLYRMPDIDIMRAMVDARANMPEWTAKELEQGPVLQLLRKQWKNVKRDDAILSVGYNAATRVLSETPVRATYLLGSRGVDVPVTYQEGFTAWEHDANGQLLEWRNMTGVLYYSPNNPACAMVEFTMGSTGRVLDTLITNQDVDVSKDWDYQVYVSSWNINLGELVGPWTNVTGDPAMYIIKDGVLIWKGLDRVNKRGILITNKKILGYQFQLDHMDHSLAFAITDVYEDGGQLVDLTFAQIDIWLNKHPLVDKVDWIYKDGYCYIINKEFLVDGPQDIVVRAMGLDKTVVLPNADTELGFVDGGVIGRVDRYNLRGDRVTRTVINGALYLTDEVPRAEREVPDDIGNPLNGKPYMVKHHWCPIRFVDDYDLLPYRQRSRETDQRVSDYLTKYLPKPRTNDEEIDWENGDPHRPDGSGTAVIPNLQDKYRLFSPFLNVVVNGVLNGLIHLPNKDSGDTYYSDQDIKDTLKAYIWWLKYDPVPLKFDRRYFAITPFANFGKLTVSDKQLIFFKQVNDLYLESVCVIEGYFEVNNNV